MVAQPAVEYSCLDILGANLRTSASRLLFRTRDGFRFAEVWNVRAPNQIATFWNKTFDLRNSGASSGTFLSTKLSDFNETFGRQCLPHLTSDDWREISSGLKLSAQTDLADTQAVRLAEWTKNLNWLQSGSWSLTSGLTALGEPAVFSQYRGTSLPHGWIRFYAPLDREGKFFACGLISRMGAGPIKVPAKDFRFNLPESGVSILDKPKHTAFIRTRLLARSFTFHVEAGKYFFKGTIEFDSKRSFNWALEDSNQQIKNSSKTLNAILDLSVYRSGSLVATHKCSSVLFEYTT